jgi:hypothetical protein
MRARPLHALALATALLECIAEPRTPELLAYEPAFTLWTDGAEKRRFLYLPPGTRIDSSDMDHWQFPIGTVAIKEFAREGTRLETRVIMRLGADEYWMGAFAWDEGKSEPRYVPDGLLNVRGTDHDIPSSTQCGTCHNGEPGKLLGFSAVQQPRVPAELLTHPPRAPFTPPGEATAQRALGYLHANCAHCHNPSGSAWPDTGMDLRLSVADRTVHETAAYRTAVGQRLQSFTRSALHTRIAARAPEASALLFRMSTRDPQLQMPPIGTEHEDLAGVAAMRAWIAALDGGGAKR